METEEAKKLISEAKNVYIIPAENQGPESAVCALALFYTLKDLGKNVNLIIDEFPENLKFLSPSLDFISYPKNFVISIPGSVAKISQVYYEKNDDALKIHLTLENGSITKDKLSFYFSETKPDLIITLGIKDYQTELQNKLNSFGFLLDSPILNIDTSTSLSTGTSTGLVQANKNFGKINIIEDKSVSEIVFTLTKDINLDSIKKEAAECLLAGLVINTENFKNNLTAEVFESAGNLMKKEADLKKITSNIYKQ